MVSQWMKRIPPAGQSPDYLLPLSRFSALASATLSGPRKEEVPSAGRKADRSRREGTPADAIPDLAGTGMLYRLLRRLKRTLVVALAKADGGLDELLYRPAVVRAFMWLPRWWLCDLAKLSVRLEDRWGTDYWDGAGVPGDPCEACGRRAAIHVYGGIDEEEPPYDDYLERRPVYVCGWCHLQGPMDNEDDVQRELVAARRFSLSWRWRWRVRP